MTYSKTRGGANSVSDDAAFLKFDVGSKDPIIGNSRPIGGVNVDQSNKGVMYPNVQSAIDDLYSIATVRIGDVLVTTNATPPQAAGQVETLTFSGTATWSGTDQKIKKTVIHVYGVPIIVNIGATHTDVVSATLAKFQELMNKQILFKRVSKKADDSGVADKLEVEMLDAVQHQPFSRTENGITITGHIDSPARGGYGTWTDLGTESKFGETLHYFKRTA